MTGKKKPDREMTGKPFDKAIAKLLQVDPAEVADEFARVKSRQEEIRKNAEKTKKFIDRAGRPAGKRFRP